MNQDPEAISETLDAGVPGAGAAPGSSEPLPESFAGGRYRVVRLLGQGGQKRVYLARDHRLDRDVVISQLRTEKLDEEGAARLLREAQTLGRLGDHPHIVTVYDVAEESGRPYLVTQYVEGGSLLDVVRRARRQPLPLAEVLRFGRELCLALEYAHSRGIVHRDLKPGNVWLTHDQSVKLGDFGLAVGLHFSQITLEGTLVGTVTYMSPEQALGQRPEPRSDLYALGVMLYELVTGRLPFLGDQLIGIISQHLHTAPVAPSWHNPAAPKGLEDLILSLLAKAPDQRPSSAAAVLQALTEMAAAAPAVAGRALQQDTKSLDQLAAGVFVGREDLLHQLRSAFNDARSGRGRLVLLVGEPGSGKTSTADQLATYARLREAQAVAGHCYEGEGAPAFWPWVQILRSCLADRHPEELASLLGSSAPDISQLVSEVRERLPSVPPPPDLEPHQARFRLFDSITTVLKNASRARPLVLILDDLHWADRSSLLLLEFLARELRDSRLLVVGTYRDLQLDRRHPLSQTLAELSRQGLGERLTLSGLSEEDVARFLELTAARKPPAALVSDLYRQTDGNPFFVKEIVRLLVSEGRLERWDESGSGSIPIPQTVHEVVDRRLDRLSDSCRRVLTIASAVGREFQLDVVEPLADLAGDQVLEALEEAVAARLVIESPRPAGRYTFAHALIRQALYEQIGAGRRVRLHRRIAERLEALYRAAPEAHFAELAHHFFQAGAAADLEWAIHYSVRAAERATLQLAYEEAVGHFERALQAIDLAPAPDPAHRCDLLLALGEAHTRAGHASQAADTFHQAAAIARSLASTPRLARAALGFGAGAIGARYGTLDQRLVDLLEEALQALGDADGVLRARLLAHLALAWYTSSERRLDRSREAVEVARRTGDPAALLAALYSRSISLEGFPKVDERLALAAEMVRVAEQAGAKEMALRGRFRYFRELLELGDLAAFDQQLEVYRRLAEELRQPVYLWLAPFYRACRALSEGRFDECEQLLQQAQAIGQKAQDQNAILFFHTQTTTLRRVQGRYAEAELAVRGLLEKYPGIPGWQVSLSYILCELGRLDEARPVYERWAVAGFTALPRDGAWQISTVLLAQMCALFHDTARAPVLYDLLLPFAGRNVVVGSSAVFYGPVSRQLGLLAATMGRWQEALQHFEQSLEMCARMRVRPFEAYNQYDYARMLAARDEPGDRARALGLLGPAIATATDLGMMKLAGDAQALRSRVAGAEPRP